jgi:hypothetical protein
VLNSFPEVVSELVEDLEEECLKSMEDFVLVVVEPGFDAYSIF